MSTARPEFRCAPRPDGPRDREGRFYEGSGLNSAVPRSAVPLIGKRAGRTGGGFESAPRRAAVPDEPKAQRGTPGRTGAQRLCIAWPNGPPHRPEPESPTAGRARQKRKEQ